MSSSHFKVKKVTSFQELIEKPDTILPPSDLTVSNETHLVQFQYVTKEKVRKHIIEPGINILGYGPSNDVITIPFPMSQKNLLETIDNTQRIFKETEMFFSKLHLYEKLGLQKKRSVLLYSAPGFGKSSAIAKVCNKLITEDPNTCVIVWPTSEVRITDVTPFFTTEAEYKEGTSRVILVMEDIGGGEDEETGPRGVPSSLLNLLDGVGITFSKPTFIIATTNYPESLLSALADRPGRFDELIELPAPSLSERIALIEFIAKRKVTEEEIEALKMKGAEGFSIAHLNEIVVRSMLHDKTIEAVVKELLAHTQKYKKGFAKGKMSMGIGND